MESKLHFSKGPYSIEQKNNEKLKKHLSLINAVSDICTVQTL